MQLCTGIETSALDELMLKLQDMIDFEITRHLWNNYSNPVSLHKSFCHCLQVIDEPVLPLQGLMTLTDLTTGFYWGRFDIANCEIFYHEAYQFLE